MPERMLWAWTHMPTCGSTLKPFRHLALVTLASLGVAAPVAAQTTDAIAELRSAVSAERERIADLEAELARRQASLNDIIKRLDALPGTVAATVQAAPPVPEPQPAAPPRFDFYGDTLIRLSTLHQGFDGCVGCPDRTVGRMR